MNIIFIPPLITLMLSKENEKGSPLTEEEVCSIRDNATAIEVATDIALSMAECRGYKDINPEKCWAEWRAYRGDSMRSAGGNN